MAFLLDNSHKLIFLEGIPDRLHRGRLGECGVYVLCKLNSIFSSASANLDADSPLVCRWKFGRVSLSEILLVREHLLKINRTLDLLTPA